MGTPKWAVCPAGVPCSRRHPAGMLLAGGADRKCRKVIHRMREVRTMPSGSYKQADVQCPFYRYDDGRRRITCEGIVDGCSLALIYIRRVERVLLRALQKLRGLQDADGEQIRGGRRWKTVRLVKAARTDTPPALTTAESRSTLHGKRKESV